MKKIFITLCAIAAVIGCQKAEMEQPQENEVPRIPVKITADIAQTGTKTTMTNENGVLKSTWKDGDKIYVSTQRAGYYIENTTEFTVSVTDGKVEFTTESEGIPMANISTSYPASSFQLFAEYPAPLSDKLWYRKFSMSASQTQSAPGDLSHIEDDNILVALPAVTDWNENLISVDFTFRHMLSVLQLDLKGKESGIEINKIIVEMLDETGEDYLVITDGTLRLNNDEKGNGTITQKAGTNKLTLNLASTIELPVDEYAQFYMTISPGHAGQTFKVTAETEMSETLEIGTMKVPDTGSIPQGAKAYKAFTVDAPVKEELDYSSAIDLSADGTANTYLVNTANTLYKFKADVKGNGFVPSALTSDGVGLTTEISPKSVLLLWYNCLQESSSWVDMIPLETTTLTLKDGYIYFKTPETFVNGNAVIAAFAEEGLTYANITVDENRLLSNATILWSWNVWASENYDIEEDAFTAGDYTIMGRNIGATVGKTEIDSYLSATERKYVAASAIGNYYQWGNKNPYPGISDYEGAKVPALGNKMYVTPTYTLINALKDSKNGNVSMENQMFGQSANIILDLGTYLGDEDRTTANIVSYTESAPYRYMKNSKSSYGYSWTGNIGSLSLVHLWGDATLDTPSDHVKTIYDPCPAGWKVWSQDAWNAIAEAGAATASPEYNALDENDANKGYGFMICGSYFPTAGTSRNTTFDTNGNLYLSGTTNTSTFYTVSNPSIYSSGYWGRKYQINNTFTTVTDESTQENVTTNSVTMTIEGNFICVGHSTPLRCIKE